MLIYINIIIQYIQYYININIILIYYSIIYYYNYRYQYCASYIILIYTGIDYTNTGFTGE